MTLLIVFGLIALCFSFVCSIAEAVTLSVSSAYVALLEAEDRPSGAILRELKADIKKPLAAILTLNTIANTTGAAGVGAQASALFGSAYLGVASGVLTLLILIFSEIIPKTVGAHYWRELAPAVAHFLKFLVFILYPFVKLSEWLTRGITDGPTISGFSRQEFAAMAELSAEEGELEQLESEVVKNLLALRHLPVHAAMTPRTVVFSLPDTTSVEEFFHRYEQEPFSRIPIYDKEPDIVNGFVLRSDLLLAQARGNFKKTLQNYLREMPSLPETATLERAFDECQTSRVHMVLIVDEYGDMQGILTLEDIIETLLGLEIVDESDDTVDMQQLAKRKWHRRAREMGLDIDTNR